MAHNKTSTNVENEPFEGFERPDASFIMCPNEFLDLLVPNYSRGCVRLVAYVLYETLRWIKDDGTPNTEEIEIPFNELIRNAGISRGAAAGVKQEAIDGNFIEIVDEGRAKARGDSGNTTKVKLKWSISDRTAKSVDEFNGFYAGRGHFTAMPHSYFSRIIPTEPLSVIKFVSVVFRFTEGYQTQFGRQKSIPLSFQNIYQLANIRSSSVLTQTIRHCVKSNYVELVQAGSWTPGVGQSKAAVYGPKYAANRQPSIIGSKTEADDRFKNRSGKKVQKPKPVQFKNRSGNGSKTEADDRFKNRSPIKKPENKPQTKLVDSRSVKLLVEAGFKSHTANEIALTASREVISNQISWLRYRKQVDNPLGFLRKAIEQNWDEPHSIQENKNQKTGRKRLAAVAERLELEDAISSKRKKQRSIRKQRLLREWATATLEERAGWISSAANRQSSQRLSKIIGKESPENSVPRFQVLDELAFERGLPTISLPQPSQDELENNNILEKANSPQEENKMNPLSDRKMIRERVGQQVTL